MAEQTIDKLQVEVVADAKGTTAVFRQLESQLSTLQRALSAIDTSKLDAVQKSVNKSKVGIDTSGISKAEKQVASGVAKIQQSLAGLSAYANAAMGGDKSSMTSFDRRVTSIQSSIDVLQEKMKGLKGTEVPTEAFQKLERQIDNASAKIKEWESEQAKMKATGFDPSKTSSAQWDLLEQRIAEAKSKITELQEQEKQLALSGEAISMPFEKYSTLLDEIQGKLLEMSNNVHQAGDVEITPKVDNSEIERTAKEAAKARQELREMFGRGVAKAFDGLKSALKKIGSALTGIGAKAREAGDKGFMKLLKYGFGIRSIYVLFRRLRKAVTESFGELQKSGAFFETTRANVEALKTSLLTLKFQFGAAFEPIFNAVAPAIKAFIDNLVSAMNALSAFMARLTGKSTYSKVKWVNTATGEAAKNAKELNKQLQKFDELNNLTTNQGGSGSSSKDETKAVYEEASVDSALGDFGKKLADLMRAGEWNAVGSTISEKLSEQLESIDWEGIKGKAGKFGHNLAEFLNGLIDPRLFGDIGHTIGEAINTGLTFFNEWGKGMNWENLGSSLASGFNEWLKAGNLPLLGETLHTWIAGGLDALNKFLEEADFEELGRQLAQFIGNLNIPDLAKKLLTLAKNIIKALATAIGTAFKEGDTTTKIVIAIATGLCALSFVGKLAGLAEKIGKALGLVNASRWGLGGAADTVAGGIGSELAKKTISVGTVLKVALLAGVAFTLGKIIWKMANGEFNSLQDLIDSLPGSKVEAIKVDTDFQGKLDKAGKSVEDLRNKFGGLNKEIQDTNNKQGDFFNNTSKQSASAGKNLEKNYSGSLNSVKGSFQTAYRESTSTWSKIETDGKNYSNKFSSSFNQMPGLVSNQFASGYAQSTMKWGGLEAWANKTLGVMPTSAKNKLGQVPREFDSNFGSATRIAESKMNDFSNWFNRLKFDKSATIKADQSSFANVKQLYNSLVSTLKNKTVTISVKADGFSSIGREITSLANKLSSLRYASSQQNLGVRKFATGGIVQGATRAIVGEAGPEAVLPLTDGTLGTLSKMIVGEMARPSGVSIDSSINGVYSSGGNSSVSEQNALLREEVQLLRQIAGKELTISSSEVFKATQAESNNYYNRTGNSPFLF